MPTVEEVIKRSEQGVFRPFVCRADNPAVPSVSRTEEFVNVGIVLIQAKAGFFDFAIAKHWKRVTGFFPELDADIYRAGLRLVRLN